MAENDSNPTPMSDADINAAPADTQFQPAAPLKDTGVEFNAEGGTLAAPAATDAKQAVREGVANIGQQATDKARSLLDDGKARAAGALDQLVQMLNDAAVTVDEKLGGQFGDHARTAANSVQQLSDTVRNKDADALLDDARGFVRSSPTVVIGIAAALGFAAARLVQAGIDDQRQQA
jgi:ElaB/YqjD/DUF883 family membrane-anchored ribosome-binding protein